jgi:GR25 family glycosyltransferase involved in LPS biosynthesis
VLLIPVVVIKTPNSTRVDPLLVQLDKISVVDAIVIEATMGYSLDYPNKTSVLDEFNSYGRVLTQNERACAISHRRAREILAQSDFGGVILEDDARIVNPEAFVNETRDFLQTHLGKEDVLTLLSYLKSPPGKKFMSKGNNTFRLLAEAPLAVGAALTPEAAKCLVAAATELSMTADWPTSNCVFFGLKTGVIRHGDSQTVSMIGDVDERVSRLRFRLTLRCDVIGIKRRLFRKIDTVRIQIKQS